MILTREIEIKINEFNFQYYENLGYEDILVGDSIRIPIELLSSGSHYKIKCQCDGCGIEKDVIFKNYIKYGNKWGEYKCRKCSELKRKKSLRKSYGVDYPIQNSLLLEKMKKKIVDKSQNQ